VENSLLTIKDPRKAICILAAVDTISERITNHCLRLLHHLSSAQLDALLAEPSELPAEWTAHVRALLEERKQHFPRCETHGSKIAGGSSGHLRHGERETLSMCTQVTVHIPLPALPDARARETTAMRRIAHMVDEAQRAHAVTPGQEDGGWASRAKKMVSFA
jgi:hypothetical protein